jgi:hypothetical protein
VKTTNLNVDLSKRYITEPLGKEALTEIIKGDNMMTAHRLYLIVNGLKERYYFQELDDHDKYTITAAINVKYRYAGEAQKQIEALPLLRPLLKATYYYEMVYKVFLKENMQNVYEFRHKTKSKKEVYDLVVRLRQKTIEICNQNTL